MRVELQGRVGQSGCLMTYRAATVDGYSSG